GRAALERDDHRPVGERLEGAAVTLGEGLERLVAFFLGGVVAGAGPGGVMAAPAVAGGARRRRTSGGRSGGDGAALGRAVPLAGVLDALGAAPVLVALHVLVGPAVGGGTRPRDARQDHRQEPLLAAGDGGGLQRRARPALVARLAQLGGGGAGVARAQ